MYDLTPKTRSDASSFLWEGLTLVVLVSMCALVTVGFVTISPDEPPRPDTAPCARPQMVLPLPNSRRRARRSSIQPPADSTDYERAPCCATSTGRTTPRSSTSRCGWITRPWTVVDDGPIPLPDNNEELLPLVSSSGFVQGCRRSHRHNNHVVEEGQRFQVTFFDGTSAFGDVIGRDADSDLAVLKIDPEGYDLVPVRSEFDG